MKPEGELGPRSIDIDIEYSKQQEQVMGKSQKKKEGVTIMELKEVKGEG